MCHHFVLSWNLFVAHAYTQAQMYIVHDQIDR